MSVEKKGFLFLTKIAYRNIYRNKRRSIMSVVAIGIAVFFIIFAISYIAGMLGSIENIVQTYETGHITIYSEEYEELKDFFPVQYPVRADSEFISTLENVEGVVTVLPRIRTQITLTDSEVKHAMLWAIDVEKEEGFHSLNISDSDNGISEGRYPESGKSECTIGARLAHKLDVSVGDRILMKMNSSQFSERYITPKIVGLFDYNYDIFDSNVIVMRLDTIQDILVLPDKAQELFVYIESLGNTNIVKERLNEILESTSTLTPKEEKEVEEGKDITPSEGFVVKDRLEGNAMLRQMDAMKFIYGIIFMVFIVLASFLVINTIIMVIHERMKEIGMMGALGMTRREIVSVFFLEALYLSLFGALFGAILATVITAVASQFPIDIESLSGGADMPVSNTIFIQFSPLYVLGGFLYGLVVSAFCTILPSLKAAFIEPVEALRR